MKLHSSVNTLSNIILKNNNRLIRYSGAVNFEMEKLKLVIESKEMTDSGNDTFSFSSSISIRNYNNEKFDTTATFTCENGEVTQDGQPTGENSVTFRDVLTISCSASNVLSIEPKQQF